MFANVDARRAGLALTLVAIGSCVALDILSLSRQVDVLKGTPMLHPMEGNAVAAGLRLWHGESPYPDPVADAAMTYMYPPLGYAIIGLLWIAAPNQLYLPRIAACLAYFGAAALVACYIKKDRGTLAAAWAFTAALALPALVGDYFFFALVNSFYLFFMIAAWLAALRHLRSGGSLVLAAVLAVAAVLTKQQAIAVPAVVCIMMMLRRAWRSLFIYAGIVSAAIAGIVIVLHTSSNGWSTRSMLLGLRHPFLKEGVAGGLRTLALPHIACLVALAAIALADVARERVEWMLFIVITACLGFVTALKIGGSEHALLPAYFVMLACGARALPCAGDPFPRRSLAAAALALACSILLSWKSAPLESFADRKVLIDAHSENTRRMLHDIPTVDGKVLTLHFGEAAIMREHRVFDDLEVALEFELAGYPALARVANALEQRQYAMILFATRERVLELASGLPRNANNQAAALLMRCADAIDRGFAPTRACDLVLMPR